MFYLALFAFEENRDLLIRCKKRSVAERSVFRKSELAGFYFLASRKYCCDLSRLRDWSIIVFVSLRIVR